MTDTPRETPPTQAEKYRQHLVEHGKAVRALLDAADPAVAVFLRDSFNLAIYPLDFTERWIDKMTLFRKPLLAECDTLRAQLAAREGEIATLTIQYEQAEAEVLRHHGREDRLKEEALSWRRVSERLQGGRLAAEARADTAECEVRRLQIARIGDSENIGREMSRADTAEAQLRAQGWQPIETAPKDGARIMLSDGKDTSVGGWVSAADQGAEPEEEFRIAAGWWFLDCIDMQPTRRAPLPAAPITKGSQPHE